MRPSTGRGARSRSTGDDPVLGRAARSRSTRDDPVLGRAARDALLAVRPEIPSIVTVGSLTLASGDDALSLRRHPQVNRHRHQKHGKGAL